MFCVFCQIPLPNWYDHFALLSLSPHTGLSNCLQWRQIRRWSFGLPRLSCLFSFLNFLRPLGLVSFAFPNDQTLSLFSPSKLMKWIKKVWFCMRQPGPFCKPHANSFRLNFVFPIFNCGLGAFRYWIGWWFVAVVSMIWSPYEQKPPDKTGCFFLTDEEIWSWTASWKRTGCGLDSRSLLKHDWHVMVRFFFRRLDNYLIQIYYVERGIKTPS